jgi:hypothetical protein
MAREQEEAPGRNRLLALGAVALLVAATAVAFGRVFTGHVPTLKLLLAGLASLAVAAALERRSPIVAALASGVGLLFAVSYLVFPDTLWYGIPAGRTFHAIALAVQHVGEQTRVQVAPTVPLRPLLMAAITALWTAAFSSHALALRSGSPLLAAVPCAALLAFAGVVMKDGPRRGYAALFLLAVMAVLFVDGLRRVRQWGPLRPWRAFGRPTIIGAASTRGARRVTFAAVAVALLLPGLLPGFRSSPWLDSIGKGGAGPEVDPLVSITASLKRSRPIPLFTVQARQGVYWRWMGLDRFDGTTWTTDDLDLDKGIVVLPGQPLPQLPIQPNPAVTRVRKLTQEVDIISSPGRWLPMAYAPQSISVSGGLRYDSSIVAAQPTSGVHPQLSYQVTSDVAEPTFTELNREFDFAPFRQYLQLPDQTRTDVLPVARGVLERAGNPSTPIGRILAIQSWFTDTGHFSYSTSVSGEHDTQALLTFLNDTRTGFCQQFAGAMAVMLRAIGIPARVAATPSPRAMRTAGWRSRSPGSGGFRSSRPRSARTSSPRASSRARIGTRRGPARRPAGRRRGRERSATTTGLATSRAAGRSLAGSAGTRAEGRDRSSRRGPTARWWSSRWRSSWDSPPSASPSGSWPGAVASSAGPARRGSSRWPHTACSPVGPPTWDSVGRPARPCRSIEPGCAASSARRTATSTG